MSFPVDVEESPDISKIGDYKTPSLFRRRLRVPGWLFGNYSDASPEKEVGESDKVYPPISQFDENVPPKRNEGLLASKVRELPERSILWRSAVYHKTNSDDFKQSQAEEKDHGLFYWDNANLDTYRLSEMKDGFECEEELNDYGYTPIHVAASNGTPLHAAAKRGRVEALKVILEACPETVKMVTVPGENCLHTAVLYNQVGAVRFLVEWLERNGDYAHLINGKDYDGKTPLHLATSRKQIQTLEVLLGCKEVDVNAMCSGSFTALDILDVLPYTGKIDVEINRIFGQAGAMRARDLANRDANSYAAEDNKRKWFKTIDMSTIKMGLLLMATLVTTITYHAAFTAAGATLNEGGGALCFFMWFNLLAFFGSLAVVMIVISKYSILAA